MLTGFKRWWDIMEIPMYIISALGAFMLYENYSVKTAQENAIERQQIVCPSFLSIARSARDTLIVMRNEPLCNRYVLDNLR